MYRRNLFVAVASLVVALLALALWIQARSLDAEGGRSDSTTTRQASAALDAIVRSGLAEGEMSDSRLWQSFSGVESVAGGVPPRTRLAVAEILGRPAVSDTLGLKFDSARQAKTPSGTTLWVVSGRGVMCLIREERIAISCSTKRKAIRHGLLLQVRRTSSTVDDPAFTTIGIVPDRATGISLQAGDVPVTLPVQANAFDFGATRSIKVLRLTY